MKAHTVFLVGVGPGEARYLTRNAIEVLNTVEMVFYPEELTDLAESLAKDHPARWVCAASPDDGTAWSTNVTNTRWAWLIPDTPSLSPLAGQLVRKLDSRGVRVVMVAGVPIVTAALDQAGIYTLVDGPVGVTWGNGAQAELESDSSCEGGNWLVRPGRLDQSFERDPVSRGHRAVHCPVPMPSIVGHWRQPLIDRKLLLLRDGIRSRQVQKWLNEKGATAMIAPVSDLGAPESWVEADVALARIDRYDWIVWTSAEAVRRLLNRMRERRIDRRRLWAKIAVVGPETGAVLSDFGLFADLMPENEYSQEGLMALFSKTSVRGQSILLPGGSRNRSSLGQMLRQNGALVDEVTIYHNRRVLLPERVVEHIRSGAIDAILYTASSAVEYLMNQLGEPEQGAVRQIPAFSIGPLTSRTLSRFDIPVAREASPSSMNVMVQQVVDFFSTAQ